MSKKIMKRSLALGALMVFVITGNAMAATYELKGEAADISGFASNNKLVADVKWSNCYPKADVNASDELVTTGDIQYNGASFGLYGGYLIEDVNPKGEEPKESRLDNPNGNKLNVKHNLTAKGYVYLYGAGTGWGYDGKDVFSSAEGNSVVIGGGEKPITIDAGGHVFIGGAISLDSSDERNVIGNTAVVDNVKFKLPDGSYVCVYGGEAKSGSAESNNVILKNIVLNNNNGVNIFGGFLHLADADPNPIGDAKLNNVTLNNVIALNQNSEFAGGYVYGVKGDATGNTLSIEGDSQIGGIVYGGYSNKGDANENAVNVTDGTINNKVYGGYGVTEANGNAVNVSGGTFGEDARLYGGSAYGAATENVVNISNVTIKNNIIAGAAQNGGSQKGDASKNNITIENSIIYGTIYGGDVAEDHAEDGNANNNEITIKNSQVFDSGKYREPSHIYSGVNNGDGDATGNKLTIDNGKFEKGTYMAAGFSGYGNANENEILVDGADTQINSTIWGGRAQYDGNANKNKVTIHNGEINGNVYGGAANETYDAWYEEDNIEANNNEVIIENGKVTGNIYGGYAGKKDQAEYVAVANNNTVSISQGTITGNIYGGYSYVGTADNNIVNINGNADISKASLYGGNVTNSTGNTLNIAAEWVNGKAKSIQNFSVINIEEAKWGTPVVEVENLVLNDTKVTVDTVRVAGGDTTFAPGASSALVTSGSVISGEVAGGSVNVFKGVATIYEATVEKSDDKKSIEIQLGDENTATYNAAVMNPQVLVIGESRAAATAFTNQGSELIETGLDALARDKETDTKAFAAVYGNTSEFATGSEVKVNGWSGIVGVGKTNANGLTVGAFFENGEGNYRTYNDVNGEFMRGDGDACYNGGGFIVRKDNDNGVYTEASLRAGNLQNELRNAVHGSEGLTGYDIDTFYYGAHVGIGKVIPRGNEGDSVDVYGKFIYTHHDSGNFTIDGDEFHFDSVDSERLRLGFRINEVQTNKLSMYYGAAWEYEFNGDSNNTVVGYDLSTPSLGGSTVIGEVGAHYNANEKWSFDFNARAYSGQRDGFSGSVQVNYNF